MNTELHQYILAVTNLSEKSRAVLFDQHVGKLPEELNSKICELDNAIDLVNAKQEEFDEWYKQHSKTVSEAIQALLWVAEQPNLDEAIRNTLINGVKAKKLHH